MKDYDFLELAQIELEEEVNHYNEQKAGLGYEFAREVANTISRILRYHSNSIYFSSNSIRQSLNNFTRYRSLTVPNGSS